MKVLVLGGTGVISREIVKLLVADRHEVTLYNRGSRNLSIPAGVRQITGDRMDRQNFESAMRAVCEPVFERPISEISFGQLLVYLFRTNRIGFLIDAGILEALAAGGLKALVMLGVALLGLGYAFYPFADSVFMMYAYRTVFGFGIAIVATSRQGDGRAGLFTSRSQR